MKTLIREILIDVGGVALVLLVVMLGNAQTPAAQPVQPAQPRSFTPTSRSLSFPTARRPTLTQPAEAADGAEKKTEDEDEEEDEPKTTSPSLKFEAADAQFLIEAYAKETGRTPLISPEIPKVQGITLRSQKGLPLTREDYLEAIEATLNMHGIVLEPYGEKFLKILPRKTIRSEGIKIFMEKPEGGHPEKNQVVSQMIQLNAITISEAQKALEGFKRPDGLIQSFERTNSLLVTDTQENINRMLEIVRFIDQPLVVREEVNVRTIRFAKAVEIKKVLEEIVAESQRETQSREEIRPNMSGAPGMNRFQQRPMMINNQMRPGLTRLGQPQQANEPSSPNANITTAVNDADRGMIRGKVQITADERSDQLIIITSKENMEFFDKIITVLDIETEPDVQLKVRRLEYAKAEDVSSMLNDLIGNATSRRDENGNNANRAAGDAARNNPTGRSTSLNDAARARTAPQPAGANNANAQGETKLGQLNKENIKILFDERTNSILLMGSPNDLKAINGLIDEVDIQLSQVLIETVVLQVELGDDIKTGIDWVQRGKHTQYVPETYTYTDSDGIEQTATRYVRRVIRDSIFNNGDQLSGGGGGGAGASGSSMLGSLMGLTSCSTTTTSTTDSSGESSAVATTAETLAEGMLGARAGISYFLRSDKLNIGALIEASKSDSRAKVLSSPVLMTVDNQEATIEATSMRYLYKGVRYSGSSYNGTEVPDYEQRDIGLTVKITPRINPNGTVVLSIDETFETIGADQKIGTESYPTVNTRKVQADVSVENMQTVVLGGLVQNEIKNTESGIPILKDIPVIGKYLFGYTGHSDTRSELLVFLTPYVMDSREAIDEEARRRKAALSDIRPWIDYGWSKSKLADQVEPRERLRRAKEQWKNEDDDHKAELLYKRAMLAREKQLKERDEKEALEAAKEAAEKANGADAAKPAEQPWVTGAKVSDEQSVIKPDKPDTKPEPAPAQDEKKQEKSAEPQVTEKRRSWWKFWGKG
ncbi:MAG: hypothetical protein J6U40_14180 [Kiritimatiellae bacterium]|nr:hypothetical protein [Kiritimatiellia bacterium]